MERWIALSSGIILPSRVTTVSGERSSAGQLLYASAKLRIAIGPNCGRERSQTMRLRVFTSAGPLQNATAESPSVEQFTIHGCLGL